MSGGFGGVGLPGGKGEFVFVLSVGIGEIGVFISDVGEGVIVGGDDDVSGGVGVAVGVKLFSGVGVGVIRGFGVFFGIPSA